VRFPDPRYLLEVGETGTSVGFVGCINQDTECLYDIALELQYINIFGTSVKSDLITIIIAFMHWIVKIKCDNVCH